GRRTNARRRAAARPGSSLALGMTSVVRTVTRAVKVVPVGLIVLLLATAAFGGVKLDVKDEYVHVILKSMQKQCAVKNLVIDPNVSGNGTFYFHDLPSGKAFDVVLSTMGLAAVTSSDSTVEVERRR